MRGYAAREIFSLEDRSLLARATEMVGMMPGMVDGEWVRCHELVRAVAQALTGKIARVWNVYEQQKVDGLAVVDGHWGHVEHSWIVTPGKKILDTYVPGCLPQVQLVDPYALATRYLGERPRNDVRDEVIDHLLELIGYRGTPC